MAQAPPLEVGLAQVDITPAVGEPLAGYSERTGASTGVADPLLGQVVLFQQGETRFALIALDLRRFVSGTLIEAGEAPLRP